VEFNDATPNVLKRKRSAIKKDTENIMSYAPDVDPFTKQKNERKAVVKAEKKKALSNEYRSKREETIDKKDAIDENL